MENRVIQTLMNVAMNGVRQMLRQGPHRKPYVFKHRKRARSAPGAGRSANAPDGAIHYHSVARWKRYHKHRLAG